MVTFLKPVFFRTPGSFSKSKYFLVETDKGKLPSEIKYEDVNGNYRHQHIKGMINM